MGKKYQVVAMGECLIDFVPVPDGNDQKIVLEGNAGGGPPNVLAACAKLGRKTALMSKVGDDGFGDFLRRILTECGVDTQGIISGKEPTTLAMVTLDKHGERSFGFYRNQTADVMFREDELDASLLESADIFHYSTVSMTVEPVRSATIAAAKAAKKAGARLSFDPNYRPFLWPDKDKAIQAVQQGMQLADYVKLSEEEAELLTGQSDPCKAIQQLVERYQPLFTAVTLGADGSVGMGQDGVLVQQKAYDIKCVDTTGAGDAFWGSALHQLILIGLDERLTADQVAGLLRYSCAGGSLATTKYGAIPAMASDAEIKALMRQVSDQ